MPNVLVTRKLPSSVIKKLQAAADVDVYSGDVGMTAAELLVSVEKTLGEKLQRKIEFRGETTFVILPTDLRETAKFCRDELGLDYLLDITSVDNFGEEPRFEIVYELYSMSLATHLRLKLSVSEDAGEVPRELWWCPWSQARCSRRW